MIPSGTAKCWSIKQDKIFYHYYIHKMLEHPRDVLAVQELRAGFMIKNNNQPRWSSHILPRQNIVNRPPSYNNSYLYTSLRLSPACRGQDRDTSLPRHLEYTCGSSYRCLSDMGPQLKHKERFSNAPNFMKFCEMAAGLYFERHFIKITKNETRHS